MLPENHTDKFRLIDARCGWIMRGKIGAAMETWLEGENKKRADYAQDSLSSVRLD